VYKGELKEFYINNGILKFGHRVCVPEIIELKEEALREAHIAPYTAHPGDIKIYQNLRHNF